jgi:hypothetical protein
LSSSSSSSLTTRKTYPLSRHRSLRTDTTNATNEEDYDDDDDVTIANTTKHDVVNWRYDWKQNNNPNDYNNENSAAAIGEYYRYKGLALANYYRSKYNVSAYTRTRQACIKSPYSYFFILKYIYIYIYIYI